MKLKNYLKNFPLFKHSFCDLLFMSLTKNNMYLFFISHADGFKII